MRAVWARAKSELRSRRWSSLALVLLIGIAGGGAISVADAARRTDTAYERFLASHAPSDVSVTESKNFVTRDVDLDAVAALPEVEQSARASLLFFEGHTADGRRVTTDDFVPIANSTRALGTTIDRWKMLDGRPYRADAIDEAVADYETAQKLDLSVGDEITLRFVRRDVFNQNIAAYLAGLPGRVAGTGTSGALERLGLQGEPTITFRVVGIATDPITFPPVPGQFRPFLRLSPAFYAAFAADLARNDVIYTKLASVSDLADFKSDVAQLSRGTPVFYGVTQDDHRTNVDRTLHLAAVVLWLLAGLVAAALVLTMAQALSRQAFVDSLEYPVLRALGMRRRQLFAGGALWTVAIAGFASLLAVGVAILLSPLWPIGLARVAEPHPGFELNVALLAIGGLLVALVTMAIGAGSTWRWSRPSPRAATRRVPWASKLVSTTARPVSVAIGARQALHGGRGRSAVPVRTTVVALTLAVATLVTAITFGASLGHLLDSPRLFGWSWDAQIGAKGVPDIGAPVAAGLADDPAVASYSTGTVTEIAVNGVRVDAFAMDAGRGTIPPAILEGRSVRTNDEIVLGTQTIRAVDAEIGDLVRVKVGDETRRFKLVGRAVFPDIGDIGQLGRGAFMDFAAVRDTDAHAPHNVALVRFADDAAHAAEVTRLRHALDPLPVTAAVLPRDLASFGRVDGLPIVVALILGAMAAAVLVYTLLTAIRRRRRDLAILKTLGFTGGDVARTVVAEATTLALLALAFGLPIGVIIGRAVWRAFADWQGFPAVPTVAWLPLVAVSLAVVLVAAVIALLPAWLAARTRPAVALRSE